MLAFIISSVLSKALLSTVSRSSDWLTTPLRCKQKRKFKATTDSRHKLPVAENLLKQQFKVYEPNAVWVSDITYVPTDEGWLYLAGHKGLFTSEIVGYAMGERLTRSLVNQSLLQAEEEIQGNH